MHPRWRVLSLLVLLLAGCEDGPPKPGPKERAEGYYIKGTTEYLQGNFEQALASFGSMKKLSPDDPRLPAAMGEVYLSMGKLNEALTQFQLALQRDPKRSTNWSRVGFIHAQLGHSEEAQSALRKALALYPRDFNALEQLGELALKRGEKDSAVKHFLLAADASPNAAKAPLVLRAAEVFIADGRHAEALLMLGEWTGPKGVRDPALLSALGDEQVRAGQLLPAAESYREAARQSPRDPTLWELVGEIYTRLDKPGDALAAYRESLRVKERAIIHVAIARIHLGRGEREAAEEELGKALETVSGSDVRELMDLAELLSTLGRKPDALRILTNLSAEPDHARDAELQRRTAALARELKDEAVVRAACARLAGDGARPTRSAPEGGAQAPPRSSPSEGYFSVWSSSLSEGYFRVACCPFSEGSVPCASSNRAKKGFCFVSCFMVRLHEARAHCLAGLGDDEETRGGAGKVSDRRPPAFPPGQRPEERRVPEMEFLVKLHV